MKQARAQHTLTTLADGTRSAVANGGYQANFQSAQHIRWFDLLFFVCQPNNQTLKPVPGTITGSTLKTGAVTGKNGEACITDVDACTGSAKLRTLQFVCGTDKLE